MANFTPAGVELIVKGSEKFFGTLDKANSRIAGFGKAAVKAAALGAAAVGAAAIGIGVASVKMAVSFESAFAGVIKTTDGLTDEFGKLTESGKGLQQEFRNLAKEVPTAVEELLAIGELGGQLGIAKDDLLDFTRTIAAMGEATNLTTEEAATGFAQIANIMGTPQEMISNMGSAVVELGNNFATTERDILSFGQRIAGAGQIAGLTEAEVFGIGAAMSSVGVQAEAGGTAVQKVLLAMNQAVVEGNDQLEIFAATSGLSAEEFSAAWEDDAGPIFNEFVKGLGLAGDDALTILSELELGDQRLIRSFLSLAGAGDLLGDAMESSSVAFADNTALAKEAAQRYATTESQFKIFKNTIKDVGITIGQALLPALNKVLSFGLKIANAVGFMVEQFKEFGIRDFFSTFEDGSSVLSGFFKKLGLGEKPARKIAGVINTIAQFLIKNIPKAIKIATKFWNQTLLPALKNFGKFITRTIIPAVKEIVRWFEDNIPIAIRTLKGVISTLAAFWEGTLLPAIQTVIKFVQDNLVPILSGIAVLILTVVIPAIVAWAAANVAAALATLAAWAPIILAALAIVAVVAVLVKAWQKDWGGIQTKTKEVWEKTLKPAFEAIKEWLSVQIPKAIAVVKSWWENTLKPALEAVGKFIKKEVIPRIEDLVEWLSENIPKAMEEVKLFWENTLRPAFEEIWQFIQDPVIVWVEKIFNWLNEKIPEAFEAVKRFWNSTLKVALQEIRDFIEDPLLVKIRELVEWVGEKIEAAWEEFKKWWDNTGKDFIQGIVDWIEDPFLVKVREVVDWIKDKLVKAWETLQKWWADHGEGLVSTIAGGIGQITENVRSLIKWIDDAIAALLRLLGLQKEAEGSSGGGGSGFDGDDDDDETTGASSFTGTSFVPAPTASMGPAASFGNTLNLTINPTINSEMDMVTFEQRVKRVVTDAVSA